MATLCPLRNSGGFFRGNRFSNSAPPRDTKEPPRATRPLPAAGRGPRGEPVGLGHGRSGGGPGGEKGTRRVVSRVAGLP
jgi:hypothetical protein